MRLKFSLFIAILLTFCSYCIAIEKNPTANNGQIDLRNTNLSNKVALDGQWAFYWNQLIYPTTTSAGKAQLVNFPVKWNNLIIDGKKLPSFGYATYKLTILLPKSKDIYKITMPDVYCAYRLYLNGVMVAENGKVGKTPATFVPHWQYKAFDIPAGIDTAKLILQISNFEHVNGGIKNVIYIGKKTTIELERRRSEAIDLLLTGCLFMGGLFFLGLYLLGNRDKAILLFSLYSIVYSYRIMGVGNYVLHTIMPTLDWYVTVRIEYISLFLSIGLFGLYTRYLYPLEINKLVVKIMCGICLLFSLATLVLPAYYFTQLINPFLVVTVFCIIYTLCIYILSYLKKRNGSGYAMLSSIAMMSIFAISLLHYWNLVPQLQGVTFAAYIGFFFLQSLILSFRVSYQLKKSREQAEQGLIAKSEFLSTMSHEIRTPLNSVIGMSHLLLENNPRKDQIEQLDLMLFSANNLLGIVNDILDFNKIEAGKIQLDYTEIDLVEIIKNIVAGHQNEAHTKGIKLRTEIDDPISSKILLGDPTRIFQVITNLVHNAIKFTKRGYVEVSVKTVAENSANITLKIQVKDTGIGISREKQDIIFDRFTQADSSTSRSFGGTGLGLAISKRILELQSSSLKVMSEEGKGAVFYFIQTFQKIDAHHEHSIVQNIVKKDEQQLNGTSILLVEDNDLNIMVAKSFLQNWGAGVDVAKNGQEALELLDVQKHQLILMDLNMPIMDGYTAAKRMRELGIDIPIVALTANNKKDIEKQVISFGMNDIIAKPFLPDELFQKVIQYIKISN